MAENVDYWADTYWGGGYWGGGYFASYGTPAPVPAPPYTQASAGRRVKPSLPLIEFATVIAMYRHRRKRNRP